MANGYSIATVEAIRRANPKLLGVQLALICVERGIPVGDVAKYIGVSRVTVYQWFKGETFVSGRYADEIQTLIDRLK